MEFDELLKQIGNLFKNYGIRSVTMDDVAHELGISKKTLYKHVNDKTELVGKVVFEVIKTESEKFKKLAHPEINAIEELFQVNKQLRKMMKNLNASFEYDLKKYYPDLYKQIRKRKLENMYNSVKKNLEKGVKEGLYRDDFNIEYITRYYVTRIESNMDLETLNNDDISFPEFFYEIFIYHIRGVANSKGIAFLESHIDEIKNDNHAN